MIDANGRFAFAIEILPGALRRYAKSIRKQVQWLFIRPQGKPPDEHNLEAVRRNC